MRQEYKQKRKAESQKMEEEKKRFGEIRKARGLKQHEMEEKRRKENLEKKQREKVKSFNFEVNCTYGSQNILGMAIRI